MSQSGPNGIESFIARYKGHESDGKRAKRIVASAPSAPDSEFDQYLASWTSFTGVSVKAPFITGLLQSADEGFCSELAAFFQTILEKEPVIAAHIQTRILSVLSCDWAVQGDDAAKAAEVEGVLRRARIHSLLRHLLDAVATGYSGAATVWGEGGASIESFKLIDPGSWTFDLAGNPALIGLDGVERSLGSQHPFQFVFHKQSLKPGIPSRGGLLRPLVWLYFFKHYAMRDQARYLERFGMPFVLAKIRREDFEDSSIRSSVLSSLAKVGSDGVGVITEDSELQFAGATSGTGDYIPWFKYIDDLCATLILGQTASSKDASGLSRGQMQENVRRDIIEADCRSLMETVNAQLIRPLEMYRYGTEGTLRFTLDYSSPEKAVDKANVVKALAEAGFRASPQWIERSFGIEIEKPQRQGDQA